MVFCMLKTQKGRSGLDDHSSVAFSPWDKLNVVIVKSTRNVGCHPDQGF